MFSLYYRLYSVDTVFYTGDIFAVYSSALNCNVNFDI